MTRITDPDNIAYADYTAGGTAASPNDPDGTGQPAHLLIDFPNRTFALTAPLYGETARSVEQESGGVGIGTLVGFGNTGGITGQALYSKFKNIWKVDPEAIRFPFPMEAITPESFEFINNWTPDDTTLDDRTSEAFITRKLIRDAGWAERNNANNIKRKYFNIITLGGLSISNVNTGGDFPAGIATVYYSQLDPGITTSVDLSVTNADVANNEIDFTGAPPSALYTGNRVIVQGSSAMLELVQTFLIMMSSLLDMPIPVMVNNQQEHTQSVFTQQEMMLLLVII